MGILEYSFVFFLLSVPYQSYQLTSSEKCLYLVLGPPLLSMTYLLFLGETLYMHKMCMNKVI